MKKIRAALFYGAALYFYLLTINFGFFVSIISLISSSAFWPSSLCEITLFLGIKKDRATGSPLFGLLIRYEVAQKGAKMPLKMQK